MTKDQVCLLGWMKEACRPGFEHGKSARVFGTGEQTSESPAAASIHKP